MMNVKQKWNVFIATVQIITEWITSVRNSQETDRSLSFAEANEEFPKIKSRFSMADQVTHFPTVQEAYAEKFKRRDPEKTQPSFPHKTGNELRLEYAQYVNVQRGTSMADQSKSSTGTVITASSEEKTATNQALITLKLKYLMKSSMYLVIQAMSAMSYFYSKSLIEFKVCWMEILIVN